MVKVLLAGASGKLGSEILDELKKRGIRARALVRDARRLSVEGDSQAMEIFTADARRAETLAGACEGVDAVVSAMGASLSLSRTKGGGYMEVDYLANKNLLAEALRAGARKFVYVSVYGADVLKGTTYAEAHGRFERELSASGIEHAFVRPTGFFYVFAEILKMAARGRAVVIGEGDARTNPVHEKDVARISVDALKGNERAISAGGPRVYTRREIAELAFEALGREPKIASLPAGLMRAIISPVRFFDRRLYDFLAFGVAASTVNLVAPKNGERELRDYFLQLAENVNSNSF